VLHRITAGNPITVGDHRAAASLRLRRRRGAKLRWLVTSENKYATGSARWPLSERASASAEDSAPPMSDPEALAPRAAA
jgi:hypothetical protein